MRPGQDRCTEEDLENGNDVLAGWWATRQPSLETLTALRSLLPVDASWGVEEFTDGNECGSDVRIWNDDGVVWGVVLRFSAVTEDWVLLGRFLSIARAARCWLVDERSGAVFPPEEEVVRAHYERSLASRFRRAPEGAVVEAAAALKKQEPN